MTAKREFTVVWNSAIEKGVETNLFEIMMEDWTRTIYDRALPMGIVREQIMDLMQRHFKKKNILPTARDLELHREVYENLLSKDNYEEED